MLLSVGQAATGPRVGGRSRGRYREGSPGAEAPGRADRPPDCTKSCDVSPRAAARSRARPGGAPARGASSRQIDRDPLDVSATNRRLTTLIAIGRDHLPGSVEQHLAGLVHRAPTGDDSRPFSELSHRPTVLVGGEDSGQRQPLAHAPNSTVCYPAKSLRAGRFDHRRLGLMLERDRAPRVRRPSSWRRPVPTPAPA